MGHLLLNHQEIAEENFGVLGSARPPICPPKLQWRWKLERRRKWEPASAKTMAGKGGRSRVSKTPTNQNAFFDMLFPARGFRPARICKHVDDQCVFLLRRNADLRRLHADSAELLLRLSAYNLRPSAIPQSGICDE